LPIIGVRRDSVLFLVPCRRFDMVKTAVSKRSFAKRSAPPQETVERRLSDLLGTAPPKATASGKGDKKGGATKKATTAAATPTGKTAGILSKVKKEKHPDEIKRGNLRRKGALEVVNARGEKEIVAPEIAIEADDTPKDSGLSLLRKAVREQSHLRQLPHQERHDFEFLLRRVATSGIVRLFNALTTAKAVGQQQFTKVEKTATVDKAEERKFVATRDAFLSALRTSQPTSRRL
jgi:hypothetical protein